MNKKEGAPERSGALAALERIREAWEWQRATSALASQLR